MKPIVLLKGCVVDSYTAKGSRVPDKYTPITVETSSGTEIRLVLKIRRDQFEGTNSTNLQIMVKKDLRLAALVSLLKAAHLTLFEMLGYNYALSAGGCFAGWNVLGKFFLEHGGKSKVEILTNAKKHFEQFTNMVRPIVSHTPPLAGTLADNQLYVCEMTNGVPWAFMIFVRTSRSVHAVVIPILGGEEHAIRFHKFLNAEDCVVRARFCRFENGEFKAHPNESSFQWGKADLGD